VIQFEEIIRKESINICEQLSSYADKEEEHTSFVGMSPTKDSLGLSTTKPQKRTTVAIWAKLLIILALIIYIFFTLDYQSANVLKSLACTYSDFQTMFLQDYSHPFTLWDAFYEIVMTLRLVFITTLFGGIIALFFRMLASCILAQKQVSNVSKGFSDNMVSHFKRKE